MASISSVVDVVIDRLTKFPSQKGFGTPLIMDINTVQTNKVDVFTDPSEMLDAGFTTSDEAYKSALALMSQNPHPDQFMVGKRLANVAQVNTLTPTVQNSVAYNVTINGTLFTFTSDADATAAEIVAGLIAAINAGSEPVTASGTTTLILTSDVAGQGFSVAVSANLANVATTANVGPATELAAIKEANDDWYCLLSTDRVNMTILQLAAAIEADIKLYGYETEDADSRDLAHAGDTTSLMAQLKILGYDRTFGVWNLNSELYPMSAWVGVTIAKEVGSATWKFKQVSGQIASDKATTKLTSTQESNILGKNGNVYTTIGGISMFIEGKVASGEFIDIMHGTDWIQARIQENVLFLFANEDKVPFDNGGIEAVVLRVEDILKQAEDRQILRRGSSVVTAPDVLEVPSADRGARFLSGLEFEGAYAGAIHKTKINGRLSV